MGDVVSINEQVESKILELRGQQVILDSEVAQLYGVETRAINQAVSRNPDKFPAGYILKLDKQEWETIRVKSQIATSPLGGGKVKLPAAFTEKGLYMLATILKSPRAVETTMAIIDTFAKVREIRRTIGRLIDEPEDSPKRKTMTERANELIGGLVTPDVDDFKTDSVKTVFKIKFLSMIEITKEVIKSPKNQDNKS